MAATRKHKIQPLATEQNFPIVGIGASAGGLDAFKLLLKAIPERSGMAYVLVQHLDPSHESILPEILQRVTRIPVHEITDDIHIAPDNIYIIPPNKILTSTDGVLQLAPRNKKILNLSIDIFFTSLAEVHREFAVGVILSGTGIDGTQGLKAVKEYGGICIAQSIKTAAYDSMPQSAINAGVVDFILAPEKIPEQLLQINNAYTTSEVYKEEKRLSKSDEDIFKQILTLLGQRSGVDFTYYKKPTLHRRIARRIAIVKKKNLSHYLEYLQTDQAEQDALFQDMLIPVTSFFRDPKTFHALTETVFPTILKNKNADSPIRMWIVGCSTGEEIYSIAISLQEFLGVNPDSYWDRTKIQIFASDVSEKAIKKARTGIYTKADVEMLSESQLEKYFIKNNAGYEVSKLIRDMCVIAPHNFLKDPPFAKMDLISCRNVLIYMDTFLQQKAFATFHYALKEDGFLLLGKSESIGASSDLFAQVGKNVKIYSRKLVPGRFRRVATELKEEALKTKVMPVAKRESTRTDFQKSAEAMMISKSPANVVVNEQMDIVHIHGDITPFLQAPQGKPTHNLLRMAREGLGFELRNALHKASKDKISVIIDNIPLKISAYQNSEEGQLKQSLVKIEIIPLTDTAERHYLILFEKIVVPKAKEEKSSSASKTKIGEAVKRYEQLEKELAYNREDMRSITHDMEAANEELQSANEELQSGNEEMQSLNEELETSKEELQSTNEELVIVNQELLDKQEQLNAARYYAESIVTTIREPLIILDRSLSIKTANASFYKKFNAVEQDTEGELFYEIQNNQWDDYLMRSLLEKILPKHERLTDFEIILDFPSIGECTLLLNALQIVNEKNSEKLILLAIEDITDRKNVAQKLETIRIDLAEKNKLIQESEEEYRKIASQLKLATDSAKVGIWSLDVNTLKLDWSKIHEKLWGYDDGLSKELTYEDWHRLIVPEDKELAFLKIEEAKVDHGIYEVDYRINRANDGALVWIKSTGQYQYDEFGKAHTFSGISIDITEQKNFTEELERHVKERTASLKKSNEDLKQTNLQLDQFAYVASHDLQEPLRKIVTFSTRLKNNHKDGLSAEVKSYLNKIEVASSRMTTLIQDLLNYSKLLQHEKIFSTTDLNVTLKNILNDCEIIIQEKKAEIKIEHLPTVEAISFQMNQLFQNLISNSLKFSKIDVPPVITITSRNLSKNEVGKYSSLNTNIPYVEIIFKDNGIGFEQQYAKQIFTIFQRLHEKEAYIGTGIGLAICKKIIETHHGEIFSNAKENEGALFHIILPVKKPQ